MLAEATTTEISKQKAPETFSENIDVARAGGKVAGDARKAIESQTGVPVITSKSAAQLNQVVTDLLEGTTTSPEKQDKKHWSPDSKTCGQPQVNELRFSNIFVEKRSSSYLQSLDLSGFFSFAVQKHAQQNSQNAERLFLRKVVIWTRFSHKFPW